MDSFFDNMLSPVINTDRLIVLARIVDSFFENIFQGGEGVVFSHFYFETAYYYHFVKFFMIIFDLLYGLNSQNVTLEFPGWKSMWFEIK